MNEQIAPHNQRPISTIIFDWGGVFCTPAEPFSHPCFLNDLKLTPEEIEAKVKDIHEKYYRGAVSAEEFWRHVADFFKLNGITAREVTSAYLSSHQLYPEILLLAKTLKPAYTTSLLSNLTKEMMEHIVETYQLTDVFHDLIFSNNIGLLKPETAMFEMALKHNKAVPAETVFIDDSKKNVAAAQELGMHGILFVSPEQCKDELRKLGIIF